MIARLLAFLLLTSAVYAAEIAEKTYPEINGVQVFVLQSEYAGDPERFFRELAEIGVDTVFFRVFHNAADRTHMGLPNACPAGGVYFETDAACTVNNLLPEMVKYAKANNIRLFAWMATRSLSFLKTPEYMSQSFSATGLTSGYGANIFHTEVRKTLADLFADLAAYDIDGILVQDDFIIKYSEGADNAACRAFSNAMGMTCTVDAFFEVQGDRLVPRREAHALWSAWKAQELAKLLKEIRFRPRLIHPDLVWAINIYYETPVYPERGLAWYAHDIPLLERAGADYFAVMAYHEQIASEMQFTRDQLLNFMENLGNAATAQIYPASRAVLKMQVFRFDGTAAPVNEPIARLVHLRLKRGGADSFVQLPINSASDVLEFEGKRK